MSTVRAATNLTFVNLIHKALRADGPRLAKTVGELRPGDRGARLPRLHEFYGKYRQQLIAHHTHEDHIFFPALAAKVGDDAMHLAELTMQHGELDGVLDAAEAGFDELSARGGDFEASRAKVTDALSAMVEHL